MNDRTGKTIHRKQRGKVAHPTPAALLSRTAAPASPADRSPAADTPANAVIGRSPLFIEPARREAMIAEAAYYRAQHRGFEPGHEFEDWCAAEAEIDGMLNGCAPPPGCGG